MESLSCSLITLFIFVSIVLINMSQTKEEKYDELIGVDKPPEVFVFHRLFARLRRLPLFLLRSVSSPREVINLTVFLFIDCFFKTEC